MHTIEDTAIGLTHGKVGRQGHFDANQIILKALGCIFLRPILALFFVRGAELFAELLERH